MPVLPLLMGSSTALGIGYFCVDIYRNRSRLSQKAEPPADLMGYEVIPSPEDANFHAVGQAINHAGHGVSEVASECASGVGPCVDAIAHIISHH